MSSYLGKFPFRKEAGQQFPLWNIFVSVSTHIKKSIVENVGNSAGIVNRFATFLKGGNIVSFNFTDVYDWSIPVQIFLISFLLHKK